MPKFISYTIQDVSPTDITSLVIRFQTDHCEVNVAYNLIDANGNKVGNGSDGFVIPRVEIADIESFITKKVVSRIASKEGLAVKEAIK